MNGELVTAPATVDDHVVDLAGFTLRSRGFH